MTDTNKQLNLVKAAALSGLPVVTIDGGEDVAEIKDVVYNASSHHLVGFTLNKRGWFRGSLKAVLAAENVAGIGPQAVMVPGTDCLSAKSDADSSFTVSGSDYNVIGNEVVSSSGTVIGKVVDVVLETGSHPSAVGYEIDTGKGSVFVPVSAQMGLSGENLIVPSEAEQFTANDLAHFGASVSSFRELLGGSS